MQRVRKIGFLSSIYMVDNDFGGGASGGMWDFGVWVLKWVVGAKVHQFIGIGNKEEGVKN